MYISDVITTVYQEARFPPNGEVETITLKS